MKNITVLPQRFQELWMANLIPTSFNPAFKLVDIKETKPKSGQELKVIVTVLDQDGYIMPGVNVAFSYSTSSPYTISSDSVWNPPGPRLADIVQTVGGLPAEHVQGSVVKQGQPGGITVYILEPESAASDVVTGMGALHDHTGVHLIFQYKDSSRLTIKERLVNIESYLNI